MLWCAGGDLNPYAFRRQDLNLVRLPISPPALLEGVPLLTLRRVGHSRQQRGSHREPLFQERTTRIS